MSIFPTFYKKLSEIMYIFYDKVVYYLIFRFEKSPYLKIIISITREYNTALYAK